MNAAPGGKQGVAFTTRAALLALCAALPLALAPSWAAGAAIFLAANALLCALLLLDLRLTPGAGALRASRLHKTTLSVGEWNEVELRVENHSDRRLRVTAIDESPVTFAASARSLEATVPARSAVTLRYRLHPPERGDHLFGDIVLLWRGLLDLTIRDARIPAAATAKVYPSVRSLARFDLALRRAPVVEGGQSSERRRGMGTEFESLKEYGPDDEFRRIDWKATARRQKLVARQFESERNQTVMLCLDVSRPMGARAGGGTLLDAAVEAALLLAHAVTRRGDRVGLAAFSDRVIHFLPPRSGRAQFRAVLDAIYNLLPEPGEPDYAELFRHLATRRMKRALVVTLTDLDDAAAPERVARGASCILGRHLPLLVSVEDPALRAAADAAPASKDDLAHRTVARELIERRDGTLLALSRAGFVALALPPERLAPELLSAYLKQKARGSL